jgi:hypothetical protein
MIKHQLIIIQKQATNRCLTIKYLITNAKKQIVKYNVLQHFLFNS